MARSNIKLPQFACFNLKITSGFNYSLKVICLHHSHHISMRYSIMCELMYFRSDHSTTVIFPTESKFEFDNATQFHFSCVAQSNFLIPCASSRFPFPFPSHALFERSDRSSYVHITWFLLWKLVVFRWFGKFSLITHLTYSLLYFNRDLDEIRL